jgi:hypothetical protein
MTIDVATRTTTKYAVITAYFAVVLVATSIVIWITTRPSAA